MKKLKLASWGKRIIAWFIDILIINAIIGFLPFNFLLIPGPSIPGFSIYSLVFVIYWTLLEGRSGQSIGKMVLNLRVTTEQGKKIDYTKALIESVGKAFLLPLDCLIGWIGLDNRQRLFNKLSNTIVIEEKKISKSVKYVK